MPEFKEMLLGLGDWLAWATIIFAGSLVEHPFITIFLMFAGGLWLFGKDLDI